MNHVFAESDVEEAALEWFEQLKYTILWGPMIAPGEPKAERDDLKTVILADRFHAALAELNPDAPSEALQEAFRKVTQISSASLIDANHEFHHYLVNGVSVEYLRADGSLGYSPVRLFDYENPEKNDWVAVNQFAIEEAGNNRIPDIVIMVNGLPLAVFELKNAADKNATIWKAFNQLQTYKQQIPSLFTFNEALIISDGGQAKIGTLTADKERFMPWRTVEGEKLAPSSMSELEILIRGVFDPRRFLDLLSRYIVFEADGDRVIKKMAGYHQYHAVGTAVKATLEASKPSGDRRVGVVWHTQGSGKSLTMAFYAGRIILAPEMQNPTLVVITDRNDLDDQLFGTFSRCHELLRQDPVQAENRSRLRELLKVSSGGVVFSTIQKFLPEQKGDNFPLLSDRRNIIVIADEAHRSQYDFIDGFARHMRDALPNASFIGFTGTPLELGDKNTLAVFGDYISKYDIQRAVKDGATVPIFYESRIAKIALDEDEKPKVDPEFEEVTEGEERERKEKLKSKWAALESVVGSEKRIKLVAQELVQHFKDRCEFLQGKAMIVCMSRRICVDLYNAIVALRPEWHSEDDAKGEIKVVMTGSASDKLEWQQHIRTKQRREDLAKRFKRADDPFKIVIIRDMWLTGFDAPCLHTMYIDKPMRGHGLMQAIARVNRVFKDKPGGLVVDYLGLATQLKKALHTYTESGGQGETAVDQEKAVAMMLQKYEVCCGLFHKFDRAAWTSNSPTARLSLLPAAQEHILSQEEGKRRLADAVLALSKAFALSVPHPSTMRICDDVGFFQAVNAVLAKSDGRRRKSTEELDHAVRQIVSKAVTSDQIVDIFDAAGIKKPDISILSDEFLLEIKGMPHKNLAVELLRKLLRDEIKARSRRHLVQSRSFAKMLENAVRRYDNRAVEAAKIIDMLITIAKEIRLAAERGEELGLTDDEVAFYDALEVNDSAVKVLGDDTLKTIARELVETVRNNVSIDWTIKESVRAKLRVIVKRILRKYGYPPDKQESATKTVLEQAELLSGVWVGEAA